MDFLQLAGKTIVVFGVANKKSVAWFVGKTLEEAGAQVVYVVRSPERRESVAKLMGCLLYTSDAADDLLC